MTESVLDRGTAAGGTIRIAYLVDFFRTGCAGTEKQLMFLLKHLHRSRFSIKLFSFQSSPFLDSVARLAGDVDVRGFGGRADISRSIPALARLGREMRRCRPDVLHTYFPASNSFGVILGRLAGVRRIVSSRRDMGFWETGKDMRITKLANRFVSRIVVNCAAVRDRTIAAEKVSPDGIELIYNALDFSEFQEAAEARGKNGFPVVGMVANLNRRVKRADLFVKASAIAGKAVPEARFWIAGDGNLRPELEATAARLGLGGRIRFLGRRDDAAHLMRSFAVGVICSDSEGLSNSIMEYMAAGLPVVATAVGGNPELVADGETGLLVPPGDEQSLSDALVALLRDPVRSRRMGQAGRERVHREFSLDAMIGRTAALYEELLQQGTANGVRRRRSSASLKTCP